MGFAAGIVTMTVLLAMGTRPVFGSRTSAPLMFLRGFFGFGAMSCVTFALLMIS